MRGFVFRQAVPIRAQLLRATGVAAGDPRRLRDSLELFESIAAVPFVARAQCELGLLGGERGLVTDGLATLERIGDVERVTAYTAASR